MATFTSVGLIEQLILTLTGLTGGRWRNAGADRDRQLYWPRRGGRLAERQGTRAPVPLFVIMFACQGVYLTALLIEASGTLGTALFALGTIPGAAALFATFPVIYAGIAARAGPSATLAFVINGATIFLGQGAGVALGGVFFAGLGLWSVGLIGGIIAVIGLLAATSLRQSP